MLKTPGPNSGIIGLPGSRWMLQTPALVLDEQALTRNISTMAQWSRRKGIGLRPHCKTHKSPDIARRQIDAGASGICCASIREAEAMSAAEIQNLLLTTSLASNKIERVLRLAKKGTQMSCVVDHLDQVDAYAEAARRNNINITLLVDIDVGHGRTGTPSLDYALLIAKRISSSESLIYGGIQAYMGHLQHIYEIDEREEALRQPTTRLSEFIYTLDKANVRPRIVTGGGTGTHRLDAEHAIISEVQAGSYVFMDADYNKVVQSQQGEEYFDTSLFVQTTVINVNHEHYAVTDAGLKSFATDGPLPVIAKGAHEDATYGYMGDEHGAIFYSDPSKKLSLGSRLECITPHCDPNVNLFDVYHVVNGDDLIGIWPISGRGNP